MAAVEHSEQEACIVLWGQVTVSSSGQALGLFTGANIMFSSLMEGLIRKQLVVPPWKMVPSLRNVSSHKLSGATYLIHSFCNSESAVHRREIWNNLPTGAGNPREGFQCAHLLRLLSLHLDHQ